MTRQPPLETRLVYMASHVSGKPRAVKPAAFKAGSDCDIWVEKGTGCTQDGADQPRLSHTRAPCERAKPRRSVVIFAPCLQKCDLRLVDS